MREGLGVRGVVGQRGGRNPLRHLRGSLIILSHLRLPPSPTGQEGRQLPEERR